MINLLSIVDKIDETTQKIWAWGFTVDTWVGIIIGIISAAGLLIAGIVWLIIWISDNVKISKPSKPVWLELWIDRHKERKVKKQAQKLEIKENCHNVVDVKKDNV